LHLVNLLRGLSPHAAGILESTRWTGWGRYYRNVLMCRCL